MESKYHKNLYKEIGKRIALQRKIIRVSQEDLSKKIKISRGSIANIEKGRQAAPLHLIYDIASALSISIHNLIPHEREIYDSSVVVLELKGQLDKLNLSIKNRDVVLGFIDSNF